MAVAGAKQDQNEEEGGGADVSVHAGSSRQTCRQTRIIRGSRTIARFIAGKGREKGGSAGGLLALAFAIENKLNMILARRCVVSLGAGAALMGAEKFVRVA